MRRGSRLPPSHLSDHCLRLRCLAASSAAWKSRHLLGLCWWKWEWGLLQLFLCCLARVRWLLSEYCLSCEAAPPFGKKKWLLWDSVCACSCFWVASVSSSKSRVLGQKEIPGTDRSAVSWVLGALVDLPLLFHLSDFSYVYFINTGYLVGEISRSTFSPSFWKQKFLDCLTFLISWILRF